MQETVDNFIVDFEIDPKTGKEKHDYLLNGKTITGVTSILKILSKGDAITQWAANQAAESFATQVQKWMNDGRGSFDLGILKDSARYAWKGNRDGAGKFGKNVHKAIENWIKKEPISTLTPEETTAYENFKTWATLYNVKFLMSEKAVYSKTFWYAGTIDVVMEMDGKVWVGDIKTSASIYPDFFLQTAAYQNALVERGFDRPIEGNVVINVRKNGTLDVKKSYGYERNLEGFLSALKVYRIRQELESELKIK
jgi:hypothetical protein